MLNVSRLSAASDFRFIFEKKIRSPTSGVTASRQFVILDDQVLFLGHAEDLYFWWQRRFGVIVECRAAGKEEHEQNGGLGPLRN
jgi:hypothetical protein